MGSAQLYTDAEISIKEIRTNTSGLHKHHYFELIYVLSGAGIHNINNNRFAFAEGDVFLLTPDDAHTFEVSEPTKFCMVDFTKTFFAKRPHRAEEKMDVSEIFKKLEYIFHNHHQVSGSMIADSDQGLFNMMIGRLLDEQGNKQPFQEIVMQNIVFLLLNLIARHIQENVSARSVTSDPKSKVHEITAYIQHHIYDKDLLRLENLAEVFSRSPDHLTRYFKAETGCTIKDYIQKYRLNLIKTRLRYSDMTISEIAYEMNFTDESHLNKVFKAVNGMTARQFKERNLES